MAGPHGAREPHLGPPADVPPGPAAPAPAADASAPAATDTATAPATAPATKEAADARGVSGPAARAKLFAQVGRAVHRYDFYQLLRRLEVASRDLPRLGTAPRPADEPIRLGQEPTLAFPPAPLASLQASKSGSGAPPWLRVYFFGLFGSNGPLPLHLTEYAADRARSAGDPTLGRFVDMFHHRLLMLFYRIWAAAQPTTDSDRPEASRFAAYIGSFVGIGMPAMRGRDAFADAAKLYYAGRLAGRTRNAEGLGAMIGDFFGMPARIQQFVGAWIDLPREERWMFGIRDRRLGHSTVLGARAFSRAHKFRVVLGPLDRAQFQRMLPGQPSLARLTSLVRTYAGDALAWDVRLMLVDRRQEPLTLGQSRLGWTSWVGVREGGARQDLIIDPELETQTAVA